MVARTKKTQGERAGFFGWFSQVVKYFQVVLERTGEILWAPPYIFTTACKIDISLYPFDSQYCKVKFGSWMYIVTVSRLTSR